MNPKYEDILNLEIPYDHDQAIAILTQKLQRIHISEKDEVKAFVFVKRMKHELEVFNYFLMNYD